MKKLDITGTHASASNYELSDDRIFRVFLELLTPADQLASATDVEVETTAFQINKSGSFLVDDLGKPIMLAPIRSRIPLANVINGMDSVKAGWRKQTLVEGAEVPEGVKTLKHLPKSAAAGDQVLIGDELHTYTEGLYESVRRYRMSELESTAAVPEVVMDPAIIESLTP